MPSIPQDKKLDSTLALLREGYTFIPKRRQRLQSDVFQTRLLLQPTICMSGKDAAEMFYDTDRFKREGAAPTRLKKILFGQGGVQGMDGEAHRHRKQLLMAPMTPEGIEQLADLVTAAWHASLEKWEKMDRVVLFYEAREILCRAVCTWAGVPLEASEVEQRAKDLGAMIDGAGAVGPRHWRGRWSRSRAEKWLSGLVEEVRSETLAVPEESVFHTIAWHRDLEGELLDERVAAVEVLNVLRPTVAVARYIVFLALALHKHPEYRKKLRAEDDLLEPFVQEVRRFYPFFPFVAARVRKGFEWRGYRFPEGRRTLLDLYGTNHDARLWEEPGAFHPERFLQWEENPFDFIPQGGGDHYGNHRCAGEWVTITLMKTTLRLLTRSMTYEVPVQDLHINLSRIPAIPKSRFVISNVQRSR